MTDRLVRLAGHGLRADGAAVTWTIADGRKGRRWRESVMRDGHLVHSLLYETDSDRRFSHLELAAPFGLVTLHPEGDDTLHGNIVRVGGVEHVVGLPFEPGSVLLVAGSPIAEAAIGWASERGGHGEPARVITLDPGDLSLRSASAALAAAALPAGPPGTIDPDGVPHLRDGATWALER